MTKNLYKNDINIKEDKLIRSKFIKLYDNEGNMYSHHKVDRYKVTKGDFLGYEYYIFRWIEGKSIMNYNQTDYNKISGHINMSSKHRIFMSCEVNEPYSNEIHLVPSKYILN